MSREHSRWLVPGTLSAGTVLVAGAVVAGVLTASGPGAGDVHNDAHNAAGHRADTRQVALNEPLSAKPESGTQQPGEFPTNARGETYGSAAGTVNPPDLVAVIATNGKTGYIRKHALEAGMPTTHAEVTANLAQRSTRSGHVHIATVRV